MSESTAPPSAPTAPPPPPPRPPLRRSRSDRKIAGVAGGLAAYFDVDPLLVRIAFVVVTIAGGGIGVLFYVACLFLIPQEGEEPTRSHYFVDRHLRTLAIIAGTILVIAVVESVGWWHHGPWGLLAVIVLVGVVAVAAREGRPPWQPGGFGGPADRAAPQPTAADRPVPESSVPATPYPTAAYASSPTAAPPPADLPPPPPRRRRERSALGPLTVGAALVVAGILVALDRSGAANVPAVVVFASALAVTAAGLVVGAVIGRSRGLIALGIVLAVATALASVIPLPGNGNVGQVTWTPSAANVASTYSWGIGRSTLDLTALRGQVAPIRVNQSIGHVVIVVPAGTVTHVHAHVGLGSISPATNTPQTGGTDQTADFTTGGSAATGARTSTAPLDVDVDLGIGLVEVTSEAS